MNSVLNRIGKSENCVLNRVGVGTPGPHRPTQASVEYPPPPPPRWDLIALKVNVLTLNCSFSCTQGPGHSLLLLTPL